MRYITLVIVTLLGITFFWVAYNESVKPKDESWFKKLNLPDTYYLQEYNLFSKKMTISTEINSITSLDNRLIAVGDQGTILTSSDLGKSWIKENSNSTQILRSITSLDNRLIAVGDQGTILSSSDLGKSWIVENSNSSEWLGSITSLDNLLIAVGTQGTILSSSNLGKSWIKENSNSTQNLISITSLDNRLIAVGMNGTILSSSDLGKSWIRENSNSTQNLFSITSLDNRLIAVGTQGAILTSSDLGKSWIKEKSNSTQDFFSITSLKNRLIVVGMKGTILSSSDLGKSWIVENSNSSEWLGSITSLDNRLIAVGTRGTILTSSDLGKRWIKENFNSSGWLYSITSLGNHLIAVGDQGTILTSSDLGKSWIKENSYTTEPLYSISSLNNRLITVGGSGTILTSSDLGKSWIKENSNSSAILGSVTTLNNQLVVVGDKGTILISLDFGKSWLKEYSNTTESLYSVTSLNNRLIAVGNNGTILTSSIFRDLWIKRNSSSTVRLRSITSLDNHLIVVGMKGNILISSDFGVTWNKIVDKKYQYEIDYNSILEVDRSHLLAVGQNGIIVQIDLEKKRIIPLAYRNELGLLSYIVFLLLSAFITLIGYFFYILISLKEENVNNIQNDKVIEHSYNVDNIGNDKSIEHSYEDRYGFRPLVDAISSLITSYKTSPPFSIVIDGAWGSGKSSIMKMVKNKIELFGIQSIFFNVWYHQNEEHILANMIENFYAKLVPPIFSLSNIIFRTNLFIKRVLTKPDHIIVLTSLIILAYLMSNNTELSSIPLAILYILYLVKKLSAETAEIKSYLKHLEKPFKLNRPNAQVGLRQEFINALNELLDITSQRVVLFIDDLDRCSDGEIMEILKTVNYLSEIKKLIIVMGVDTPKVKDAIVRNYQIKNSLLTPQKAQKLASEYLQKIFNNTIHVPTHTNRLNEYFKIGKYEVSAVSYYSRYFKNIEFFISKYYVVLLIISSIYFIDYKTIQNDFNETVKLTKEKIEIYIDRILRSDEDNKENINIYLDGKYICDKDNNETTVTNKEKLSLEEAHNKTNEGIHKDYNLSEADHNNTLVPKHNIGKGKGNLNYIYPANVRKVPFYREYNFQIVSAILAFLLIVSIVYFIFSNKKDNVTELIEFIFINRKDLNHLNPREQKMFINRVKLVLSFKNRELFFMFNEFQSIFHINLRFIIFVLFFLSLYIKNRFSDAKNVYSDLMALLFGKSSLEQEAPDIETINYVIDRLYYDITPEYEYKEVEEILKLVKRD